jgi:hypothetical protein
MNLFVVMARFRSSGTCILNVRLVFTVQVYLSDLKIRSNDADICTRVALYVKLFRSVHRFSVTLEPVIMSPGNPSN